MTFQPIASYGFIGNLGSCALVGMNGSIDWCCLPRIDSPSVFGAILDPERGGSFVVAPAEPYTDVQQSYVPQTNVLVTRFSSPDGVLELTDWMHMSSFSFEEQEQHLFPAIYRLARCVSGTVRCRVLFDPRLDYARGDTAVRTVEGGLIAEGVADVLQLHANCSFDIGAHGAEAIVTLQEDEDMPLICTYGKTELADIPPAHRGMKRTIQFWKRWTTECESG